ncbi:unnamed protein product [Symbiodinium sp. CCMP2592]|nr:unnamed protein product [Symbiodinium sp. CCMP2592]
MLAGELRVRGVEGGQLFECVENIRCEMDILGFDLTTFHAIQAVPLNGTCGETDAVSEINVFNPNVMVTGEVGAGNLSTRRFVYDQVTVPQRYKICYCMLASCDNATHFTEEVGILVVKGVEKLRYARTCSLGALALCGSLYFRGRGVE